MPKGARLPTVSQIIALATEFGMEMSEADAASYQSLMVGAINSYRRLDEFAEAKPPVKYPRTPGYRPPPEENPYNAWYVKTDIKGAEDGPLAGMRVAVKDAVCVAGVPMMGGSMALEGFMPDIDATVITRLLDAGATIAGKVHTEDHSFSAGGHTTALGPTRNPRKPDHAPGGSSTGSAVVLVTGEAELALGADQGGSIRIPAAWSGIVGLKPTYGLVPYTGAMTLEATIDHLGPMANSVSDCAKMLSAMAGPDPLDPRQRGVIPVDYVRDYDAAIGRGCKNLRVAVVKEGFNQSQRDDLGLPGERGGRRPQGNGRRRTIGKGGSSRHRGVRSHALRWRASLERDHPRGLERGRLALQRRGVELVGLLQHTPDRELRPGLACAGQRPSGHC